MTKMLTVQETLTQTNIKKLAKKYVNERMHVKSKKAKKKAKKKIKSYIEYLLTLKPNDNKDKMIFYVSHDVEQGELTPHPYFNLQKLNELGSQYDNYGCEYSPFQDTLGYYIANTWRTQHYLKQLLVDILYEMSWTGYRQEHLHDECDFLGQSIEEIKDPDSKSYTVTNKIELYNLFETDITKEDHLDRYEYQLLRKINLLSTQLYNHSRNRESNKIKNNLQ